MHVTRKYQDSRILYTESMKRSDLKLRSNFYTILRYLWSCLIILITIVNKILLNRHHIFDGMIVAILLYVIFFALYAVLAKSVYGLNHKGIVKLINLIKNTLKLSMNLASIYYYGKLLVAFYDQNFQGQPLSTWSDSWKVYLAFLSKSPFSAFMFLFTLCMTIWSLFTFLVAEFRYLVPPFCLVTFFRYIYDTPRVFEQYVMYDSETILCNYRRFGEEDYWIGLRRKKLLIITITASVFLVLGLLFVLLKDYIHLPVWIKRLIDIIRYR